MTARRPPIARGTSIECPIPGCDYIADGGTGLAAHTRQRHNMTTVEAYDFSENAKRKPPQRSKARGVEKVIEVVTEARDIEVRDVPPATAAALQANLEAAAQLAIPSQPLMLPAPGNGAFDHKTFSSAYAAFKTWATGQVTLLQKDLAAKEAEIVQMKRQINELETLVTVWSEPEPAVQG